MEGDKIAINMLAPLKDVLADIVGVGQEEVEFDVNAGGVQTTWSIRLVRLVDEDGTVLKDTIQRVVIGGGD